MRRRIAIAIIALAMTLKVCSGIALACLSPSWAMSLPWGAHWIVLTLMVLLIIDYFLLYNKAYFCIDLALLVYMGVLDIPGLLRGYAAEPAKCLIDCFLLSLLLATLRILSRHELRHIFNSRISAKRKLSIISCVVIVISLWIVTFISPRPLIYSAHVISALKHYGAALDMYATDNQGFYPGELNDVIPTYLKVSPLSFYEMGTKDYDFLGKRYTTEYDVEYEFINTKASQAYTMCVSGTLSGKLRHPVIMHASRDGFVEPW